MEKQKRGRRSHSTEEPEEGNEGLRALFHQSEEREREERGLRALFQQSEEREREREGFESPISSRTEKYPGESNPPIFLALWFFPCRLVDTLFLVGRSIYSLWSAGQHLLKTQESFAQSAKTWYVTSTRVEIFQVRDCAWSYCSTLFLPVCQNETREHEDQIVLRA